MPAKVYQAYYGSISNEVLWMLQHHLVGQFGHSSLDAASEEILADDHVFLAIPVHIRDSDPENGRKLGFSQQGPRLEMIASIQIIPNRNQCRSSHANKPISVTSSRPKWRPLQPWPRGI